MIYISCSEEEFDNIIDVIDNDDAPCMFDEDPCLFVDGSRRINCSRCIKRRIKRINTDIKPEKPNYNTEAENKAFLQGFNVAVKKMRGDTK